MFPYRQQNSYTCKPNTSLFNKLMACGFRVRFFILNGVINLYQVVQVWFGAFSTYNLFKRRDKHGGGGGQFLHRKGEGRAAALISM